MGAAGTALLLLGLGGLLAVPDDWGFSSSEVVIPRRLTPRGGEAGEAEEPGRLSYLLPLEGRRHVLHLRPKKLLLPRRLPVFTFTARGELLEEQPYVPQGCYYRGAVEGAPDSLATFSTCFGGLWGMLQLQGRLYQVEPLPASATFEHRVSRLVERPPGNLTCGLTDEEIAHQAAQFRPPASFRQVDWHDAYIHPKYVELAVAVDNGRYKFRKNNISAVIQDTILLISLVDSYFAPFKAHISLKALEIWNDTDKVKVINRTVRQILTDWTAYQSKEIYPRVQQDFAHLYVFSIADTTGTANLYSMCKKTKMASLSMLPGNNLVGPSKWTAHKLGHSCGIVHDGAYCWCGRSLCIMNAFGRFEGGFSNCSFDSYFVYTQKRTSCLLNFPGLGFVVERCGNKVVESGEQCDCGSARECKEDPCCLPNCTLRPGMQCLSGPCCRRCQFLPAKEVCRPKKSECDLEEFCNGTSNLCPSDMYIQDGTPCSSNAVCYRGTCHSHLERCRSIFGKEAKEAPLPCYDEVNYHGDRFGNCGYEQEYYLFCEGDSTLCGRVQCVNVQTIPSMPEHTTVIQTHLKDRNITCWGTEYHLAMGTLGLSDIGDVQDGTLCGSDLICINRTCHELSLLNFNCKPEKCNHRGVCNNQKHCHCDFGWAPPFCETPGDGGSIDSGPAGKPLADEVMIQIWLAFLLRIILFMASLILTKLIKLRKKALLK
ncbi:disintegrin and metalloproteinase domain-containing protein 30-like [Ornithorhynchus anatinus]|uniref:disintegrin and metalloproteinase domain-containing protein 30-like n=1 Tax=Ornithorhynchus anatinus TaxID=9258 RepID=UPI0019D4B799|nr:disintegrin and metalloproteinase domain-containing protein 30-like [Ornithorhynchus anatinus]